MKKNVKRNLSIIRDLRSGMKSIEIANKYGVTKQRVNQILKHHGLDPRKTKQDEYMTKIEILYKSIKKDMKQKLSAWDIWEKYNLTQKDVSNLKQFGLNISKKNELSAKILKRNKELLRLYKKGYTANEIMEKTNSVNSIDMVYKGICDINNGSLPKRINTTKKISDKLSKEVIRLKKKHTFNEVHKILLDRGFTNSFKAPLRIHSLTYRYYKKDK